MIKNFTLKEVLSKIVKFYLVVLLINNERYDILDHYLNCNDNQLN
jgi:hypothetical protein